jgi:multisubunit Na+/H+ antiporter MnhF subunit
LNFLITVLRALHIPFYRRITSPKAFKSSVSASSSEHYCTVCLRCKRFFTLNLESWRQLTIIGLPLNFLCALHISLYRIRSSPNAFKSSVAASSSESNTKIIMTIIFLAAACAIAHFAHGIMNIPTMNEKIELVESQADRLQFVVHRLESDSNNNFPFQLE